jgi:heavy metal translocating P-type ATPase
MVAEAREARAPFVRLADRIAAIFLPVALVTALAAWLASGDVVRAVAVLVVATPCPLILAAPVAMASGISRAARRGVIIKGGAALEALAGGTIVLLDKTGTLTSGRPVLRDFEVAPGSDANEVLLLAASLDQMSPHVLAGAIVLGAKARSLNLVTPSEAQEEPGRGIRGVVNNHNVAVGRGSWVVPGADVPLWARRVRRRTAFEGLANVFVATDGQLTGAFVLEDPLRPDAARTLRTLRRAGIQRIVMVTGDHVDVAETVGEAVGVDEVLADRSPEEKVAAVRDARDAAHCVMVGDGINDAPALAAADVGVVMGARGSTASSEAGDVVILTDRLERLAEALRISRRTRRIAFQSAATGMGLSAIAMVVAALGLLAPVGGPSSKRPLTWRSSCTRSGRSAALRRRPSRQRTWSSGNACRAPTSSWPVRCSRSGSRPTPSTVSIPTVGSRGREQCSRCSSSRSFPTSRLTSGRSTRRSPA